MLVALCCASTAYAQQWHWQLSGHAQVFNTKQAAVAFMHSLSPAASNFTTETPISIAQSSASYIYTAPMKPPIVMTDWWYTHGSGLSAASEAEIIAARLAVHQSNAPTQCPQPQLVPNGNWIVLSSFFGVLSYYEARNYRVTSRHGWTLTPTPHCVSLPDESDGLYRLRNVGCPANYQSTGIAPHCEIVGSFLISGRSMICPNGGGEVGNPCNVTTGDKTQREVDVSSPGPSFERTYHSYTLESSHKLGMGWTHNYERKVLIYGASPGGLIRANGMQEPLNSVATNHYISSAGSGLQLKKVGTEWVLYLNDGSKEIYDATGKLVRLMTPAGQATLLNYTGNLLTSVVGPFGHALQFSYSAERITQVLAPAGQPIVFSYDSSGNLTQATYPDTKTRLYHYEDTALPNHLTGITDEAGARFATFAYDSMGRAILTQHAGGADEYTLSYGSTSTSVTDPLGTVTTYQFNTTDSDKFRKIVSKSVAGLTQNFTVSPYASDFQRRVTQEMDARSAVTNFNYDRDHVTSQTQAFGTPPRSNHDLSLPLHGR